MTNSFLPGALPTLIGSLPLADHGDATNLILEHLPEIPLWAQLPVHGAEGMMIRFSEGPPGLRQDSGHVFVNTRSKDFEQQLLQFYEEYFDRFILYAEKVKAFIDSGKILAWGIVPTLDPDEIGLATGEEIWDRWMVQVNRTAALGIDVQKIITQPLNTPTCGMGSLGLDSAEKVISLTTAISRKAGELIPKMN